MMVIWSSQRASDEAVTVRATQIVMCIVVEHQVQEKRCTLLLGWS